MATCYFFRLLVSIAAIPFTLGCYNSIYSFGDSIADTGNQLNSAPPGNLPRNAFPPYGETYFHRPTGRWSDGRLIIDFIAEYAGLPLVPPYLGNSMKDFQQGVNFAVGGATALNSAFLEERGIHNPTTNSSLNVQIQWFKDLLPSLCSARSVTGGNELLRHSLILMGEIGGNDYNFAFFQGIALKDIRKLVPHVVNTIGLAIKDLIELGATSILVPGNLPIGCIPAYLTAFRSSPKGDYDSATGCINWLNKFSEHHNKQLQLELASIRDLYPHTKIMYADYYNPAMQIYNSPNQFGFGNRVLQACCGEGGPYNFNSSLKCGKEGVTSCDEPSLYASWDGLHFTEAAYRLIAKSMIESSYLMSRSSIESPNVLHSFQVLNYLKHGEEQKKGYVCLL